MSAEATDPAVIEAIEAEFKAAVREAARVATLQRLGILPPPAPLPRPAEMQDAPRAKPPVSAGV